MKVRASARCQTSVQSGRYLQQRSQGTRGVRALQAKPSFARAGVKISPKLTRAYSTATVKSTSPSSATSGKSSGASGRSFWSHLEEAPLDSNHATAHAFDKDPSPLKVNLGRGVYKDDKGKDYVLECVRKAEAEIASTKQDHSYLPFNGYKKFTQSTAEFAFSRDSHHLKNGLVATVQTISGTGALRVGAEFLGRAFRGKSEKLPAVYVSEPTYVNHYPIFQVNGFEVKKYRYYDLKNNKIDFEGFADDIKNAPEGSIILYHACAHNPTGMDPTSEQWNELSKISLKKGHVIFFDSAYQGFASGDPDRDASAFRQFAADGHQVLVAQSYAKNFGLYGQRIGALNVVTSTPNETKTVLSQLNQVIRPMYSNPPLHGARIVATVFEKPELNELWRKEVKSMADRLNGVRKELAHNLTQLGSKRDWSHIYKQIGMFAYSGLSKDEVQRLRDTHVYLNFDGRMSVSGINSSNIK